MRNVHSQIMSVSFLFPVAFVLLYIFYINVITIADTHVGIYAFVIVRGKM